jgi:butyryl-CoA dehydrogenase
MNFELSEEQLRTQQAAREFAERVLAPRAANVDREGKLDAETISELRDTGFFGLTIPRAFGGSGQDFVTLALVIEELAAGCANTAAFVGSNVVVARSLLAFGNDELKSEFLTNVAQGATLSGFVLPDLAPSSSNLPTARDKGDGMFELQGQTGPITWFDYLTRTIVFGGTSADCVTAFYLPNQMSQWSLQVLPASLGKRAAPLAIAQLTGLIAPKLFVLGEVDGGLAVARSLQGDARIIAAAEAIGIARAAYEQAVKQVKQTTSKTEPGLTGNQVFLADICVEIEAARLLTLRAAHQADAEVASNSERSMAKLFAAEMAGRAAQKALQIFGGLAVATNPALERNFRDARMTELSTDSLELQRAIIAHNMLNS